MPKTNAKNGNMGQCPACRKQRLLDEETGLCMPCENDALKEKVMELELQLSASTRECAELRRKATA